MPNSERRVQQRVNAELEIRFIHDEDYLISYSKDISPDGMFIRTEAPPQIGEKIKLKFSIGELEPVTVDAKVVWLSTSSESPKDNGMGVQFIKPPKKVKAAILEIVNRIAVLEQYEEA